MNHPYSQIPEIAQTAHQLGVVRIPIERDVPFSDRVRAIVDTAEFRRLAQITQLALTSRVYPGAIHSRFEHALGVYHNALAYLWQLGRDERFADVVSTKDAEILLVAALLHDIGHWPFCHPIEDLALANMPAHEVIAERFLGRKSELTAILNEHWQIAPDDVLNLLVERVDSPGNRLCRSILSGPIDIDKMDYLERDSLHCGVPYGKNFDRQRLIGALIPNAAGDGLAITTKGRTAAEMMVFARYVMFSEVYWHHAVRSATAMFARAFYETHRSLRLDALFTMNEPDMIRALCESADTETRSLCDGLFGRRRRLHKRLAEYSVFSNADLYQSLRGMTYEQLVECSDRLGQLLQKRCGISIDRLDVLIDAPPLHREVEFKVDVYDRQANSWQALKDMSPIVNAMSDTQFDDCVKRVRIFAAEHIIEELRNANNLDDIVREALE